MAGGVDVDRGDARRVVFSFPSWRSSAIEPGPGPGGVVRRIIMSRNETTTHLSYKSLDRNTSNSALHAASRMVSRESAVGSIRTIEEYEAFVFDEKDKLVIVRFHAPWCKVRVCCQRKIEQR